MEHSGVGDIGRTLAFAGLATDGDILLFHIMDLNNERACSKPKCNILWGKMWHGKKLQPIEY